MKLRDRQKRGNITFTVRVRGKKHGSRWRRRDFIIIIIFGRENVWDSYGRPLITEIPVLIFI